DPRNAVAHQYLKTTCYHQARTLTRQKRHAEAVAVWDGALRVVSGDARPDFQSSRAATLARAGDHARATAQADEVARGAALPGQILLGLARAYTLSAAAVRQDAQLAAADRDRLAEQYAARAVQMLARGQEVGHRWNLQTLKDDAEVAALQS